MLARHYQDAEKAFNLLTPFKNVLDGSFAVRVKEAFV